MLRLMVKPRTEGLLPQLTKGPQSYQVQGRVVALAIGIICVSIRQQVQERMYAEYEVYGIRVKRCVWGKKGICTCMCLEGLWKHAYVGCM